MQIVSNSSPLIVLSKTKKITILKQLFASVYIPEKVYDEVYKVKKKPHHKWIKIKKVQDLMAVDALDAIVDRGEAEAIILAKEMNIKQILIDDRKGVNLARKLGLEPLRTTAVLGIAYKNGLITDLRKELLDLREKGYWITDFYIETLLNKFNVEK